MRLTNEQAAEIRACKNVYRASDVARHYECHRSTIKRVWDGQHHADVAPALEPPNLMSRSRPSELVEDIRILRNRGMSPEEVAAVLNVSVASIYAVGGYFT